MRATPDILPNPRLQRPGRPPLSLARLRIMLTAAIAVVAALPAGDAPGQTNYTWRGSVNSDPANPANWQGDPAVFNTTANARISVYNAGASPLIYGADQGTTIYQASGTIGNRALFIGSTAGNGGDMIITGGTFDSRGGGADGIGNLTDGSLTIAGGHYTNVNGGTGTFHVGFQNGAGTLTIDSGSFTVGELRFGDNNSSTNVTGIVHLNGGILQTNLIRTGIDSGANAPGVTGTVNFNGGTLRAGGSNGTFMQNITAANILAGGAIIDTQGFSITINQDLAGGAGNGGLTKQGSGTLVLTGNNTYTGDTLVGSGTLRAASNQALGTSNGDVTVANNARLELSGGITIANKDITITGNGGDFNGALRSVSGNNIWNGNVTLGANNTRLGAIGPGQSLEVSGVIGDNGAGHSLVVRTADSGGEVILSGANTYGGNTDVLVGIVRLAGGDDRLPTGTTLRLGNPGNTTGTDGAVFDLNGNQQTVAGLQSLGSSMLMEVTNTAATAATLTVNNTAASTYNGRLSGNLALTKTGTGSLTLGGSGANNLINDYTGLTTVTAGNLFLNKAAGGQAIGGDILVNGGNLRYSSATPAANQIAPGANLTITSGNFNSSSFGPVTTTAAVETLASVTLTGGSFSTGGSADFTVAGATTVDRSGGIDSIFTVGSGSIYRTDSLSVTDLNAAPTTNNSQPNTFTVFGNNGTTQTVLAVGPDGLAMENSRISLRFGGGGNQGARLVLDGNLTATGGGQSLISADITNGSSGTVSIDLGSTVAPVVRTIEVVGGSTFVTTAPVTNGASSQAGLNLTGNGIVRFSGNLANTYSGPTTVTSGVELQLNRGSGITSIAGDLDITGGRVSFGNANQLAATTHISMTGASSVLNGTGINTGQSSTAQQAASLTISGGTFNLGSGAVGWNISGLSSFTGNTGGNTLFIGNSNGTMTTGGLALTDMTATRGNGPLATPDSFTLYGASATRVTTLTVGSDGLTLDNSRLNLRRGTGGQLGSRLVLDGDVTTIGSSPSFITEDTAGGTGGLRDVQLTGTRSFNIGADAPLLIDVPATDGSNSTGALTKTGDGTMTLAGDSSYSGPTTVQAGTLLVDGNNTAATGDVTVQSGAILGGNGTLGGATLVSGGAVLSPGNSAGILTFTQNLTLAPQSTYQVDVLFDGTDTDRVIMSPDTILSVDGALLDGTWDGSSQNIFRGTYTIDVMHWIFEHEGTAPIDGRFANTVEAPGFAGLFDGVVPHLVTLDGQLFAAFYESQFGTTSQAGLTNGNDMLLMAIPEPSRALLLTIAAATLLLRRRR